MSPFAQSGSGTQKPPEQVPDRQFALLVQALVQPDDTHPSPGRHVGPARLKLLIASARSMRPSGQVGEACSAPPPKVEARKIAPATLLWCDTSSPRYLPTTGPPKDKPRRCTLARPVFASASLTMRSNCATWSVTRWKRVLLVCGQRCVSGLGFK